MSLGKVFITAGSVKGSPAAVQLLRDAGCTVELADTPLPCTEDWLLTRTADAAALILAMEPVTERILAHAAALRIIARPGVGYDTVDIDAATRHGVAVTIAEGANHESVADHAFGLLLMAARGLLPAVESVRGGGWARSVGTEVWGKTLAVIGFGRTGQAMARRARGFSMRVLVVAPREDRALARDMGVDFASLEEALSAADFVSLHAPLTARTSGLIDARALARMKPGAYLINTSRGALVDEAALAAAVREGRLAGAAVDVLVRQGAGSDSLLIGVPNILVTPHMASFSREAMERVALAAARSVVGGLRGETPSGLVNPAVRMGSDAAPGLQARLGPR